MENKLIIFDLDGVLIDSRNMHYVALNSALEKIDNKFVISMQQHLSQFDGLSTTKKLQLLTDQRGLDPTLYDQIWQDKQSVTLDIINNLKPDQKLIAFFAEIKSKKIQLAVASNSIRNTVKLALIRIGVLEYVDYYVSNQDVTYPKPFPEMFWLAMTALKTLPKNTVIFEDSHIGRHAALESGAHLLAIKNSDDLTKDKIEMAFSLLTRKNKMTIPWKDPKLNVLIPMAGAGSRFAQAGYTFPKPLIDINNKPMIQLVVENLNIDAHYIFIVQKEHYDKFNLKQFLNLISPNCDIVITDGITQGAACTTLLAKHLIDNNQPLVIANSDQFVEWNSNECMYAFTAEGIDGGIITFNATHPKWSFVKLNELGLVEQVAEKNPISDIATVGIYYWSKGADYVRYAEQMIDKNIRTNNEFYVCPVFNQAIEDNKKIRIKMADGMWGLGTPEDLKNFLENYK
jgi:HAD superfamily hydrolase (TIGR01509 family)